MKLRWWNSLLLLGLIACSSNKPAWEYMPDMANQPAIKAQEHETGLPHQRSLLQPVPGTLPRGYNPYLFAGKPEAAGNQLKNPLPHSEEVLLAGQKLYNIYCIVCHGEQGLGNGSIIPKFPKPPSLHSEKVRNWSDGRIYHVITEGQNLMPSYATQIDPSARWALIHYLRVLQRSQNPLPEDAKAYQDYRAKKRKGP